MSFPIPHTNPVQYQQVRETLQTGDLLFFAGTSPVDFMIEALDVAAGDPPYSHVGMVIRDGSELYFWDAPGGGNIFRDPYAALPRNRLHTIGITSHPGCRVAPLDLVLPYYMGLLGGHFWVRHLTPSVT
ncbi:MAG TPA: hypothetical protein VFU13_02000, partial [Steroidobacteraceae bacterium]|nr:hypothetical protein [Steroidobacteraceae bacterium]